MSAEPARPPVSLHCAASASPDLPSSTPEPLQSFVHLPLSSGSPTRSEHLNSSILSVPRTNSVASPASPESHNNSLLDCAQRALEEQSMRALQSCLDLGLAFSPSPICHRTRLQQKIRGELEPKNHTLLTATHHVPPAGRPATPTSLLPPLFQNEDSPALVDRPGLQPPASPPLLPATNVSDPTVQTPPPLPVGAPSCLLECLGPGATIGPPVKSAFSTTYASVASRHFPSTGSPPAAPSHAHAPPTKTKSKKPPYLFCQVSDCGQACKSETRLAEHLKWHARQDEKLRRPLLRCIFCERAFTSKVKFNLHMAMHEVHAPTIHPASTSAEPVFTCSFCGASFSSKRSLAEHKKTKCQARRSLEVSDNQRSQPLGIHSPKQPSATNVENIPPTAAPEPVLPPLEQPSPTTVENISLPSAQEPVLHPSSSQTLMQQNNPHLTSMEPQELVPPSLPTPVPFPQPPLHPSTPLTRITRSEAHLNIFFPAPIIFHCPEEDCPNKFRCETWSTNARSLKRHLLVSHNIKILTESHHCAFCQETIQKKIKNHACFSNGIIMDTSAPTLPFKCSSCPRSFPGRKSLQNHAKTHQRAALALPSAPSGPLAAPESSHPTAFLEAPSQHLQEQSTDPNDEAQVENPPQPTPPVTAAPPPIHESDLLPFFDTLSGILDADATSETWDRFCSLLPDIVSSAQQAVRVPANPPNIQRAPINIDDPQAIQKSYRRNRRKTIRLLTSGQSSMCNIQVDILTEFFSQRSEPTTFDPTFFDETSQRVPSGRLPLPPFTPSEVAARIKKFENTSPGPDRLTYRHWSSVDPEADTLAKLFNICLKHRRVPPAWKTSRTILIHKKGSEANPANWRPIALGNTLGKIFSGLLASRLTQWLSENDILHPGQKGFLPFDGVFENNFLLSRFLSEARFQHTDAYAAWLDFSDAFGSLPHAALPHAIRAHGLGDQLADIVEDLYKDTTTSIISGSEETRPIPLKRGILQGDPLSGLLFILAIDPLLWKVNPNPDLRSILAYADDLTPVAASEQELQGLIDTISTEAKRISLHLNPGKCASIHLSGRVPTGCRPTTFLVDSRPIRALKDGEQMEFLGKPVGFLHQHLSSLKLQELIDFAKSILNSKLAYWQRLDAIKTFFYPALTFALRTAQFSKTQMERVDAAIRPLLKDLICVPVNATNNYLFGSPRSGALSIPILAEEVDLFAIDNAFKLLTSVDPFVRITALRDLQITIQRRTGPDHQLPPATYLSGEMTDQLERTSNPFHNSWTQARMSSERLNVKWSFSNEAPTLEFDNTSIAPSHRRSVARTIRLGLRLHRDEQLLQLRSQGKALECVALHKASTHFLHSGQYTRFKDWRFLHKARLNLLPLHGCKPWSTANKSCRRCHVADETLPHVLNHCNRNHVLRKARHEAVVERVKKMCDGPFKILAVDRGARSIPELSDLVLERQLRPDLILQKGRDIFLVDVTIPFENGHTSFPVARAAKIDKYEPLRAAIATRYRSCSIVPIIVGSLGSWDPANDAFLRKACSKTYAKLFRALCVSDTIRLSGEMYHAHIFNRYLQYPPQFDLPTDHPEPSQEPAPSPLHQLEADDIEPNDHPSSQASTQQDTTSPETPERPSNLQDHITEPNQ